MDKGAEFEIGKRKFKLENLYYIKQGLEKGKFKEENISKTQSANDGEMVPTKSL